MVCDEAGFITEIETVDVLITDPELDKYFKVLLLSEYAAIITLSVSNAIV